MNPSYAAARLAPRFVVPFWGLGLLSIPVLALIWNATDAPPPSYVLLAFIPVAIAVDVVLYATRAMPFVRVSRTEITYRSSPLVRYRRKARLHPGDVLVVTADGMVVRRYQAGYERLDVDVQTIDAGDWERLREWAASVWPQPPDHTHRGSVVE